MHRCGRWIKERLVRGIKISKSLKKRALQAESASRGSSFLRRRTGFAVRPGGGKRLESSYWRIRTFVAEKKELVRRWPEVGAWGKISLKVPWCECGGYKFCLNLEKKPRDFQRSD